MEFAPGSIIKRKMIGFWSLFYNHLGIYIGDNMVIHFSGETKKADSAIIRKESLQSFAKCHKVKLHAAPKNSKHAKAVCQEAERLLNNANNRYNNSYAFVCNNCEDFCVHCYEVKYQA